MAVRSSLVVLFIWASVATIAFYPVLSSAQPSGPQSLDKGRIFLNSNALNTTLIPINTTAVGSLIGIAAIIALIVVVGFIFVGAIGLGTSAFGGYGTGLGNYGYGSSYQPSYYSSYSKLSNPSGYTGGYKSRSTSDNIDWSNLNILDYISMMEEMWRKFDVKDVECQKRVLCELHQNRDSLGQPAEKVVNAFGYLRYLSFMKLPSDMNSLLEEYQEAADKGRTFNKDCGEIFNACNFSFKDTYLKYVGNKSNNSL